MATLKKGDRVVITAKKDHGKVGVIFWEGPNKYGPGKRFGVRGDGGETYWASEDGLEQVDAPGEPEAPAPAPAKRPAFRASSALKALRRPLEDYDDAAVRRVLATIPAEKLPGFLWEHVGKGLLTSNEVLNEATARTLSEVPLEAVIAALEARTERSTAQYLPGVGEEALRLLLALDLGDEGALFSRRGELPRHLQWALWLARGWRKVEGQAVPEEIRAEIELALPAHVASGAMGHLELGTLSDRLGIPLDALREPGLAAIESGEGPLAFAAIGCLLFDLEAARVVALAPRIYGRSLTTRYLCWWLDRRDQALPEEPLGDTISVILALSARVKVSKRKPDFTMMGPADALEAGALLLAERQRAQGLPIPDALLGFFTPLTCDLSRWQPVFETLELEQQRRLLDRLRATLQPQYLPQTAALAVLCAGDDAIGELIAALERDVDGSSSVSVDHLFLPLGSLGARVVEPLARRIDELTEQLDPKASTYGAGYRPRRKVIALRDALALALAKVTEGGGEVDERFDAYLGPEPRLLFEENDDFPYSFFSGLRPAQGLFARLPEARVRAWIERWRQASLSAYLEERLGFAIPRERQALLAGAPGLAQQIERQVEKAGLPAQVPIYLLTRVKGATKGAAKGSALNRVGGRPKGLSKERWPVGVAGDYQPVLSLDLVEVPELKQSYAGARALCLFVDDPGGGFDGCAVVALTEAECAEGFEGGAPFIAERVLVPSQVFSPDPASPSEDLRTLRRLVGEAEARALGAPFFIQDDPHPDDDRGFVLQASERFSGLNLGDMGRLYVYSNDAFWQCY